MKELTMGEKRFLNESADGWKMAVFAKAKGVVSEKLDAKMDQLADAYVKAFTEFYTKAAGDAAQTDTDRLQMEFEDVYRKEHPEFFDIDALVKEG